ncbi:MAG: hypothetical protein L3J79_02880 [Candidatus Marinimicrobia bacterium]|nr:hypothetical protein [Candidatus Neomarinimicrobiota bacterium]
MKKVKKWTVLVALIFGVVFQAEAHFTPQNEIRQRVLPVAPGDPEILLHIYTNQDTGNQTALAPVGVNGSIFELWVDVENEPLALVDTKWIGQGGPRVELMVDCKGDVWNTANTGDTVGGQTMITINRRTRADQGYVASARAMSLSSDPTHPQDLREVMYSWSYLEPEGSFDSADRFTFNQGANYSSYVMDESGVLDAARYETGALNGPIVANFSGSLSQFVRKDMLSADAFPGVIVPQSWNMARVIVTTWPMTTARISQLDSEGLEALFESGQVFVDQVRKIIVKWDSIYPGTVIYANIKKVAGGQESILEISRQEAPYDVNEPQEHLTSTQLNDATMRPYFNRWGNGQYVVQIINENLPFDNITDGREILVEAFFTVRRDMNIKGSLGTVGSDDVSEN